MITRYYGVEKLGYYITIQLHRIATYTHWKCYMGFCTSRCTVINSKKKKKKKREDKQDGTKMGEEGCDIVMDTADERERICSKGQR